MNALALAKSGERAQFTWIDELGQEHVSARVNEATMSKRGWITFSMNDGSTLRLRADQEVDVVS